MPEYPFTAESIASLRDGSHLSWAKVGQALKLGSPGAARRAYSALVGPHTGSVLPNRTQGTKGASSRWPSRTTPRLTNCGKPSPAAPWSSSVRTTPSPSPSCG